MEDGMALQSHGFVTFSVGAGGYTRLLAFTMSASATARRRSVGCRPSLF